MHLFQSPAHIDIGYTARFEPLLEKIGCSLNNIRVKSRSRVSMTEKSVTVIKAYLNFKVMIDI